MKKTSKIIIMSILFFIVIALNSKVHAASASISASSTSVTVGQKVTITVNINAASWGLQVGGSASGSYAGVTDDAKNASTTKTTSFTPSSAGTYTVSLSGTVTDGDTDKTSSINKKITITASAKTATTTTKTTTNTTSNTAKTNTTKTNSTKNNTTNTKNATEDSTVDENTKEPTFTQSTETMYSTGDINVRKSYSTESEVLGSLKTGEKVSILGTGDNGWTKINYNGSIGFVKSSLLTNEEPEETTDSPALKSLELSVEGLNPEFNPETLSYTLELENSVDKITVDAETEDENANVEVTGNTNMQPGDNTISIVVTSADGKSTTYTINVTNGQSSNLGLSSLKVDGYSLSPSFSKGTYQYKLSIIDPSVTSINVIATASDDDATIDIQGNKSLSVGENKITISVTSADGNETVVYQITVTKSAIAAGTTSNKNNLLLYAGAAVIGLLLLILLIVFIIKRKKARAMYDDDANEDETDYSDLYGYSTNNVKTSVNANSAAYAGNNNYGVDGSYYNENSNYDSDGSYYNENSSYGSDGSYYNENSNYGADGSYYNGKSNYDADGNYYSETVKDNNYDENYNEDSYTYNKKGYNNSESYNNTNEGESYDPYKKENLYFDSNNNKKVSDDSYQGLFGTWNGIDELTNNKVVDSDSKEKDNKVDYNGVYSTYGISENNFAKGSAEEKNYVYKSYNTGYSSNTENDYVSNQSEYNNDSNNYYNQNDSVYENKNKENEYNVWKDKSDGSVAAGSIGNGVYSQFNYTNTTSNYGEQNYKFDKAKGGIPTNNLYESLNEYKNIDNQYSVENQQINDYANEAGSINNYNEESYNGGVKSKRVRGGKHSK